METKGTGSDVLQPHRGKGAAPLTSGLRRQLGAAQRLRKLVPPKSQTARPVLIREPFQMFASCGRVFSPSTGSPVYILSEQKLVYKGSSPLTKGKAYSDSCG